MRTLLLLWCLHAAFSASACEFVELTDAQAQYTCTLGKDGRSTIRIRAMGGPTPMYLLVQQDGIDVTVNAAGKISNAPLAHFGLEVVAVDGLREFVLEPKGGNAGDGEYTVALYSASSDAEAKALALASRAGFKYGKAKRDDFLGAAADYEASIPHWRAAGLPERAALAHYQVATAHRLTDTLSKAVPHYEAVISLLQGAGEPLLLGRAFNGLGLILLKGRYDLDKAEQIFNQARELATAAQDRIVEAAATNNVCLVMMHRGRLQDAQACLPTALELFDRYGNRLQKAIATFNLAVVERDLGHPAAAGPLFDEALILATALNSNRAIGKVLKNRAAYQLMVGDYQKAIDDGESAVELLFDASGAINTAEANRTLAMAYRAIGATEFAKDHLLAAQEGFIQERAVRGMAETAYLLAQLVENSVESLGYLDEALATLLSAEGGKFDPVLATRIRLELVRRHAALNRLDEAFGEFVALNPSSVALALPNMAAELGVVYAHLLRAHAQQTEAPSPSVVLPRLLDDPVRQEVHCSDARVDLQRACQFYARAAKLYASAGNVDGEAVAMTEIGSLLSESGKHEGAAEVANAVVARAKTRRATLASPMHRAAFMAGQLRAFEILVEGMLDTAADGAAMMGLAQAERMRARSLREARDWNLDTVGRRISPNVITELRAVDALLDSTPKSNRGQLMQRRTRLRAKLEAALQLAPASSHNEPVALGPQVGPINEQTAVLYFFAGRRSTYAWLLTDADTSVVNLGDTKDLSARIEAAFVSLRFQTHRGYEQTARLDALASQILGPFWSDLRSRPRLIIAPDGDLWRLPFAALPTPDDRWLLESHSIEYVPSLDGMATDSLVLRAEDALSIMSISDPLYQSVDAAAPRLPPSVELRVGYQTLRSLPGTRRETDDLRNAFDGATMTILTGSDASREQVFAQSKRSFDIVHFGTHGIQNAAYPSLSGLALSAYDESGIPINEFLSQSEIAGLNWRPKLVILSACETTLGRAVSGEGMYGLAREFLATGANAVVATNWQIDDSAAQIFSGAFFLAVSEGRAVSAAMREGQLALMGTPVFSQPHFWAPYVLHRADFSAEAR